jgi:hypothetical protein
MRLRALGVTLLLLTTLFGCSGLEGATADLKARLQNLDLEEALGDLTDCGQLADRFVSVVKDAVGRVDEFGGSAAEIPAGDMADIVEEVSVSKYYDFAERLGCARVQAQLDLVDRLVDLDAETPAGAGFLDEVIDNARSAG